MPRTASVFGILAVILASQLLAAPAQAQGEPIWVSSATGSDVANCGGTPASPCSTLRFAIGAAGENAEIRCLSAVEDLAVVIDKPLTIDCTGAPASVFSFDGGLGADVAIIVNMDEATYPNGVVILRGLTINAQRLFPGPDGIRVLGGGAAVHVEDCRIMGFAEQGIDFRPTASVDLFVRDTIISNNAGGGIVIAPAPAAAVRGSLSNVRLDRNGFGFSLTKTSGGLAAITIEDTNVEKNVFGVRASGASAFIMLSGSTVAHNSTGLQSLVGGRIGSSGNNTIILNGVDGVPTSTIPLR